MHIVVKANNQQREEFMQKPVPEGVSVEWFLPEFPIPVADAYFDLQFEAEGNAFATISDKPVFVNAVIGTLHELPANYSRINAWNGFLKKEKIEWVQRTLPATDHSQVNPISVLQKLGWKYHSVPDIPGMIAARVIAMIINEAFFALGDEISSKTEMDTAMKLGTNYPYGPFEWGEKIGLSKIYGLLKKLSETDNRYAIAPALEKEIANK